MVGSWSRISRAPCKHRWLRKASTPQVLLERGEQIGEGDRRTACGKRDYAILLPGFFEFLAMDRGLRPASIRQYLHHLRRFEAYLSRVGIRKLHELSPAVLSAFIAE